MYVYVICTLKNYMNCWFWVHVLAFHDDFSISWKGNEGPDASDQPQSVISSWRSGLTKGYPCIFDDNEMGNETIKRKKAFSDVGEFNILKHMEIAGPQLLALDVAGDQNAHALLFQLVQTGPNWSKVRVWWVIICGQ